MSSHRVECQSSNRTTPRAPGRRLPETPRASGQHLNGAAWSGIWFGIGFVGRDRRRRESSSFLHFSPAPSDLERIWLWGMEVRLAAVLEMSTEGFHHLVWAHKFPPATHVPACFRDALPVRFQQPNCRTQLPRVLARGRSAKTKWIQCGAPTGTALGCSAPVRDPALKVGLRRAAPFESRADFWGSRSCRPRST